MTTLISLDSPPNRYGIRQAMRSEITKLRTLRSTKITIAALVVGSLRHHLARRPHISAFRSVGRLPKVRTPPTSP